jgi:carbon-monoxide dehydrogenase medium subunit
MKNLKEFYYPLSLEETLEILSENENAPLVNVPVAGSTAIVFSKNPKIKGLIDINRLGLDYIKKDNDTIKIGAAATAQKIYQSELIKSLARGILSSAAKTIGSRLIRNSCTIGGNIAGLRIWSDFPVALLALDGHIMVKSKEGERLISAEDFFAKKPSKILKSTELVTEIIISVPPANSTGSFIKFSKTKFDYSLMNTGACLETDRGKILKARIAVSAVTMLPVRLKSIENFIEGKILTEDLLEEISKKVKEEIIPVNTYKVSSEYRKHLAGVLVKRVLEECFTLVCKQP